MSIDHALAELARPIEDGQPWPRPTCPNCQTGYIGFEEPATTETHGSIALHDHDGFEPDWITGTFVVEGRCGNPDCRQIVHGVGDFSVDMSGRAARDPNWPGPIPYSKYFTVRHLHPPMLLMPIPRSAPDEVREGVLRASRVLFADPGLAATALRAAVERFLTAQGIAATNTATGKFRPPHKRIEEWRDTEPGRHDVAALLFAVKWLGNAGTHEHSDLTVLEVLEGAGFLDEAFHRLFTGPDIDKHAQTINAAKGPHRPRHPTS